MASSSIALGCNGYEAHMQQILWNPGKQSFPGFFISVGSEDQNRINHTKSVFFF